MMIEHQKDRLTQYKQIVMDDYSYIMENNINTLSLDCLHELFINATIFLNTEYIYKFLELKEEVEVEVEEDKDKEKENGNGNGKEKENKNRHHQLKSRLNINYQDADGNTVLHYICSHKSQKKDIILYIVKLFLQHHADINIQNHKGFTPLMYACLSENEDVAKLLINHHADINAINHNRQTAVMLSCLGLEPCRETINILIEKGADLDIQDTLHQDTALTLACTQYQNSIIIKDLIIRGKANINLANGEGNTPLILACQNDIINIPKLLVDYGAEINARNTQDQSSALLVTINSCNYSMMKYLIDHGADINIRNCRGETPLMIACKINNKYMAEYLLKRKPDKTIHDCDGHTAKDITILNNYHSILGL
eukprot:jgi/Orpsp1_1/1188873/evm.model.d7180000067864.1